MNDLTVIGNVLESVLWFACAVGLIVQARRTTGRARRWCLIVALAFLAFGVSDLIESQTGAWWRPWWLLALKGACVGVFLLGLREYRRHVTPDTTLRR